MIVNIRGQCEYKHKCKWMNAWGVLTLNKQTETQTKGNVIKLIENNDYHENWMVYRNDNQLWGILNFEIMDVWICAIVSTQLRFMKSKVLFFFERKECW